MSARPAAPEASEAGTVVIGLRLVEQFNGCAPEFALAAAECDALISKRDSVQEPQALRAALPGQVIHEYIVPQVGRSR